MQIRLLSLMVDDQEKALAFYTSVLGFEKKIDLPMGAHRWLTLTSPDGLPGVELLLEPMEFPPARVFQKALYDSGIPATAFFTQDILEDVKRLKAKGVRFRSEPAGFGVITAAIFDDTCGNLINLVQPEVMM
jgi:catechol 2,3-dioxygenase-like lactoylglutathione lyase family enzyme